MSVIQNLDKKSKVKVSFTKQFGHPSKRQGQDKFLMTTNEIEFEENKLQLGKLSADKKVISLSYSPTDVGLPSNFCSFVLKLVDKNTDLGFRI